MAMVDSFKGPPRTQTTNCFFTRTILFVPSYMTACVFCVVSFVDKITMSSRRNNVATRAVIFIYNILRIAYRNQSLLPMDFFRFSFVKITVLQNRIHKYNTQDTEGQTSLIFIMCVMLGSLGCLRTMKYVL